MFSAIVFSKDRALQLDLFLKSLKKHFKDMDHVRVIYLCSDKNHKESYSALRNEHRKVLFKEQCDNLFQDIFESCCLSTNKYLSFFTDDDIVYKNISKEESRLIDSTFVDINELFCFSLRLGLNTTKRDVGGVKYYDIMPERFGTKKPSDDTSEDVSLIWNRTSIPFGGYWSYPLSVDGHVFKRTDMLNICEKLYLWSKLEKFKQTPNEFESKLQRFNYEYPCLMACFQHSKVVNSPNNRVQNDALNRNGDTFNYDSEYCNSLFMKGKRLDLCDIDFTSVDSPHTELKIINE